MKLAILYITILSIIKSCPEQHSSQSLNPELQSKSLASIDTNHQLSNDIMVIYQDNKYNYWFGSWKDGLYKYDGQLITHYTIADGLLSNRVEEIKEDKYGNLYVNTSKGLCKFDKNRFSKITESKTLIGEWKLLSDDLWFKCLEQPGHVFRFDGTKLFRLQLPKIKIGEDLIQKHPSYPNPYHVYCIYKDKKTYIWFGTAVLGACRYNGKTFDWITETDVTEIHDGPSNGVRSIAEDKNGDFWFNTEYRYKIYEDSSQNKKNANQENFYNRIKSIGSLDGNANGDKNEYLSIVTDNDKRIWIATYIHGVWMFDGDIIKHYPVQVNSKNISLYCLYKDHNGDLWLGTHENSVFKFNGHSFEKFTL